MPGSGLCILCAAISFNSPEVGGILINPISQMRTLRHREGQHHTQLARGSVSEADIHARPLTHATILSLVCKGPGVLLSPAGPVSKYFYSINNDGNNSC